MGHRMTQVRLSMARARVACLYWGPPILIPIALAILITFLLDPVVSALRRVGLPQTPAVLLVVILVVSVAGGIGSTPCSSSHDTGA